MNIIQRLVPAAAAVLLAAGPLWAKGDGFRPGEIEDPPTLWAPVLYLFLFVAAAAVVAFKSSRRTHLD